MRLPKLKKLGRPITPRDLRNRKVKSGYDYVLSGGAHNRHRPFRAQVNSGGTYNPNFPTWYGPRRAAADMAAQDFCDWFNGREVESPATLVTAGHEYTVDERDSDPEYEAALGVIRDRTAQRSGEVQDYLYMMIETEYEPGRSTGGALTLCKVGHSTNPRKRLAEVQAHNPRRLALLYVKPLPPGEDDKPTHRRHMDAHVLHEWFRPSKALLFEFKPEDRHTDERAYTKREKAAAAKMKEAA